MDGQAVDYAPFRHDVSNPKSLPGCVRTVVPESIYLPGKDDGEHNETVANLAGTVIAKCENASLLVFVGRSPELLYEYLRACYRGSRYATRLRMFLFSCRLEGISSVEKWIESAPSTRFSLRPYMRALGLTPVDIMERKGPTALVDFVYAGTTMNCLFLLLSEWCLEERLDLPRMLGKLRIISIERYERKAYFLREHECDPICENEWIRQLGTQRVRRIWIDTASWKDFSENDWKSCPSHSSEHWDDPQWKVKKEPFRYEFFDEGIRICLAHYQYGVSKEGRKALRKSICSHSELRFPKTRAWLAPLR